MCKKVLINPETESFINDLKREYNNSIVKPYKKTRDVLEILMKKFVLYQKVSIQKMDAITPVSYTHLGMGVRGNR